MRDSNVIPLATAANSEAESASHRRRLRHSATSRSRVAVNALQPRALVGDLVASEVSEFIEHGANAIELAGDAVRPFGDPATVV
jgi:hypothetical protein